jgi:hypothetical protein
MCIGCALDRVWTAARCDCRSVADQPASDVNPAGDRSPTRGTPLVLFKRTPFPPDKGSHSHPDRPQVTCWSRQMVYWVAGTGAGE